MLKFFSDNKDLVGAIIALISSIASVIATYFAYKAIQKSQQTNYGSLYLSVMDRYSSNEMLDSLRKIGGLKKEYGNNFAHTWITAYNNGERWAHDIDYHRRKVKYFYRNLSQLVRYKYIEKGFAETICSPKGSLLLEQVILPLDVQLDIPYDKTEFEDVLKIINKVHGKK